MIFLTGCLVGWIYEEIFYWITEGMLRNRGILYGPWLPIYGVGALGIYAMKPMKKHPVSLFFLCAGITGVVEYVIGFAGIHLFGMRLWDYRGLFLNIDGIICFRSVVSFAVMGCSIVAAICFGIVSYNHFYRGRIELGWTFSILTAAQLVLAVMNDIISKKKLTVITL